MDKVTITFLANDFNPSKQQKIMDIIEQYGSNIDMVLRDADESWKEEKPEKPDYTERNAEIRRLRSEGMTLDAIAKKYGITRLRVSQIAGKEKKDTLGFSPEVYGALERGLVRQGIKEFTIKNLTLAIEEGLPVQNIGETRIKEISYILGREVTGTREYDEKRIKSLLYVGDYVTILRFKKEVTSDE